MNSYQLFGLQFHVSIV